MALGILFAPFDEGADGSRCSVEDVDAILLHDCPPSVAVGVIRRAFIHDDGRPVGERTVNDVTVPCHPTDVGSAPVDVIVAQVKDPFGRGGDADEVTALHMQLPFRLTRCAAGVEDVERVFAVHFLARAV